MRTLNIVKIGGEVIDNDGLLSGFLEKFGALQGPKILVHGGGKLLSEVSQKMGLEVTMVNGRRVTSKATMDVALQVYAGRINKSLVANLQAAGCDALGLCGADLNIIPAVKRPVKEIDYGLVGDFDPDGIQTDMLIKLLEAGVTPVFCPITHDTKGILLNTNADTMASGLAIAMNKHYTSNLVFCFDKNGVLSDHNDEHSVVPLLNKQVFGGLMDEGAIHSGMIPKLGNAFDAIAAGVNQVVIKNSEDLLETGGTEIVA